MALSRWVGNYVPYVDVSDSRHNDRCAPMTLIYLIRHGQEAALRGEQIDPGLSDLGRDQANAMAASMRALGPLSIVCSPLARARETTAPLAVIWNAKPVIEPAMKEIPSPPGEDRKAWFDRVSAGSWRDADDEVVKWRQDIIDYLGGLQNDTVIFSHFVVISAVVGVATGSKRIVGYRPGNCSITILENINGALTLIEQGSGASTAVR